MNAAVTADSPRASLTPRETAVLERLMGGDSNKEIAARLGRSVKTVEYHVSRLLQKFGVTTRLELVTRVGPKPRIGW